MTQFLRLIVLFAVLLLLSGASQARQMVELEASHSSLSLYTEQENVVPGRRFWLAAQITPRDGWHSYWENPGDSGAAPIFDWALPEGVSISAPVFGVPEALPAGPLMNYGYKDQSYILFEVIADPTYSPGRISGFVDAEWLVCEVECVPQFGNLSFDVAIGDGAISEASKGVFESARAALPDPAFWDAELTVGGTESTLTVLMDPSEASAVEGARFFPLADGVTDYAAPQSWTASDAGLEVRLPRYDGAMDPSTGRGILVLEQMGGDTLAVEVDAELKTAEAPQTRTTADALPLWQAALFSLIGGIILNLMPCVFPVLSLKAFSLVKAGEGDMAKNRREGWAYTFGILSAFAVIVAVLVALRSGGAAVGWGFQLQDPLFIAALIVIMTLVGLSMSGLFNIQTGFEGAGQGLTQMGGVKGSFFTGVLATLVATPCTAPFMAPAIGFALTQPVYVIAVVFGMLGFGLALPFLALSYSRTIAAKMPRPGPWMETVKEGLAFPMYATVVWLLSVFMSQAGSAATIFLLGALVVIAFAAWLQGRGGRKTKAIALGLGLFALGTIFYQPEGAQTETGTFVEGEHYSEDALQALLSEGDPVFAYFTADWCITCKVNERVALFREETQTLFKERGIRVIKGDWTNRNAEIARVLERHGRAGVPLYLYYPAGATDPVVLPEILTPGIIRDAVS